MYTTIPMNIHFVYNIQFVYYTKRILYTICIILVNISIFLFQVIQSVIKMTARANSSINFLKTYYY